MLWKKLRYQSIHWLPKLLHLGSWIIDRLFSPLEHNKIILEWLKFLSWYFIAGSGWQMRGVDAGTASSNGWIEANHLFFAIILWEVRKIGPSSKVGCSCGLQRCVTHWLTKLMTHELSSPFTGNPAATPWPSSNPRYHLLSCKLRLSYI